MAGLPFDASDTPPSDAPNFFPHNLLGQFIQTSMQKLESIAQKMDV